MTAAVYTCTTVFTVHTCQDHLITLLRTVKTITVKMILSLIRRQLPRDSVGLRCLASAANSPPIFRQLFDSESCTYTYLLADPATRDAVLIDPVIEKAERDVQLVRDLGLRLKFVMNTHVHADHITGTGRLKKLAPGCQSVISEKSGGMADILVRDGDNIQFGEHSLQVSETPGHTEGCVTYIDNNNTRAFTGDALLIRGCGRTDFQGGSADTLYSSVWSRILSLPDHFSLYPAHDYKGVMVTSVAEEKLHNPRLTKSQEEFVKIMEGLGLPYPKKIDESLPANMVCGLYQLPDKMKDWV